MATNHVSIRLTHALDEESEYRECTTVNVDILFHQQKIGSIKAVIIDRQRIAEKCFYSAFDGHSADVQWVGCALMEPRFGRTKLTSLAEYDDPEFDFMYIATFHVDDEYRRDGSTDVASTALRQFLHHPFISGNLKYDFCWKVSSVAYALDPTEAMSHEELKAFEKHKKECRDDVLGTIIDPARKQALEKERQRWDARLDVLARQDANPFLRNGFFQDPAIAMDVGGSNYARILVASHGHFREPLKSHAEAVAVKFCTPPSPASQNPTGKDGELFRYLKTTCSSWEYQSPTPSLLPIRQQVQMLLQSGASVARSHGLHAACMNNVYEVVQLLLELEPAAVNCFDGQECTPLMCTAVSAAGRVTNDGISETRVLDYLLAHGADKGLQDRDGLTAFGHFNKQREEYNTALQAMMGMPVTRTSPSASERAVQGKLAPPGGPSPSDLAGGQNRAGIMDYTAEDFEADREMGRLDDDYDDY